MKRSIETILDEEGEVVQIVITGNGGDSGAETTYLGPFPKETARHAVILAGLQRDILEAGLLDPESIHRFRHRVDLFQLQLAEVAPNGPKVSA
jgi:hypothetical protein